jgi:hypothetical protein
VSQVRRTYLPHQTYPTYPTYPTYQTYPPCPTYEETRAASVPLVRASPAASTRT